MDAPKQDAVVDDGDANQPAEIDDVFTPKRTKGTTPRASAKNGSSTRAPRSRGTVKTPLPEAEPEARPEPGVAADAEPEKAEAQPDAEAPQATMTPTAPAIPEPVRVVRPWTAADVRRIQRAAAVAGDTPVFSALLSAWEGPAGDRLGLRLERSDADLMPTGAAPSPAEAHHPPPALLVRVANNGANPVIVASGEFTGQTGHLLADPVRLALLARPGHVEVDLSGVVVFTADALRTLLALREFAGVQHGGIKLCAVSPQVRDVMQATGAHTMFIPEQGRPDRRREPVLWSAVDAEPEARQQPPSAHQDEPEGSTRSTHRRAARTHRRN